MNTIKSELVLAKAGIQSSMNVQSAQSNIKLKKACSEFESIFLYFMFKEMDKSVPRESGIFEDKTSNEIFRDMFYQEMAKNVSESKSIGIANLVQKQFGK